MVTDERKAEMRAYYYANRTRLLDNGRDYKRRNRAEFRFIRMLGVSMKEARVLVRMKVNFAEAEKLLQQGFEV